MHPLDVSSTGGTPRAPERSGSDPATSRRRRRRVPTTDEKVLVGVIVAAAALCAVAFSSAAPTATPWIDGVQRGLLGAAVALAGSRARRWTLLVGPAVVAVAAPGIAAVVAIAALVVAVVLAQLDRRSRILGAAVGAVVGVLSLRLEVPGLLGTETVLGLAATLPIVVSGVRMFESSRRGRRRTRRRIVWGVAGALVVFVLVTGVAGALSVRDVEHGVASARAGLRLAGTGDVAPSSAAFASAHQSFEAAHARVGAWWASGARVIPGLGANIAAVQQSIDAGLDLTDAARGVTGEIRFDDIQMDGGGVDLDELERLGIPMTRAAESLGDADDTLRAIRSPWLVRPLTTRLADLRTRVSRARRQSDTAVLAVRRGPEILGSERTRRYLFLFGNPAELRDLGGHIGNWAELDVTDGQLSLGAVGSPTDLVLPADQVPDGVLDDFPRSFVEMDPAGFPQNWGAERDLPTVARLVAELYPMRTGRRIDGVVYADVEAFAALLSLSGPIQVPDLEPPVVLTPQNAVQFLTVDQFTLFARESVAGDALESVIHTMFDHLTTSRLPAPAALGRLFAPLVRDGHLRMTTLHPDDDPFLDRLGLRGEVPEPAGHDLLGVLNRNAGPSKIDSRLRREVTDRIAWDPDTGGVQADLTVVLHNDAPPSGLNRLIIGNSGSAPPGTNVTDLVVLTPLRLRDVAVDGAESVSQPQRDGDLWRHTVRVAVPPESSRTVTFRLYGTVDQGPRYALSFVGQPLLDDSTAEISVNATSGRARLTGAGGSGAGTFRATVDQARDVFLRWRLEDR